MDEDRGQIKEMKSRREVLLPILFLIGPLTFIVLFFYYPLASVIAGGLSDPEGGLDFTLLLSLLKDSYYRRIIGFTIWQAFLSTLISVVLGIPGAYILARFDFRGKGFIRALTTVPFVLPSIVVVLGFVRFFGNNGVLNRFFMGIFNLSEPPLRILYSFRAILLAHAFYNFPVVVRIVSSFWERIGPSTEEAARSLGAHGFGLFRRITLPQILPAVFSSAALVFIFCLLSFVVVLVLGGGPRFTTLEVEVYRLAKVNLDLDTGSALALIGALISLVFLYLYIRIQHGTSFTEEMSGPVEKPGLFSFFRSPRGVLFFLYFVCMTLVILAPMITVIANSFHVRTGWGRQAVSLEWYRRIFTADGPYLRAVLNSLFFAAATILLALPLGTILAYVGSRTRLNGRRLLESLVMLPIGVSSIILGLGYLKAYQHFPFEIVGTWYAIVFAHTVIAYPFVIRVLSAAFRKMKPSLSEAGRSLGAGPWRLFWNLELPMVRSSLVTGAAFAFGISVGEINATMMLYNENLVTIPVMIYRLIGSYNFIGACAMGAVLMVFCFLAFLIIDHAGGEIG